MNASPHIGRSATGYTLIELMTTVAVAGVLLAAGAPALNTFLHDQQLATASNSLVLSLNYARDEAVKRDSANGIIVCASADGANCSNANTWETGWIVFDPAPPAPTPAPQIINVAAAVSSGITLHEAGGATQLVFYPNGSTAPPGAVAGASFTVTACDYRGAAKAHQLNVNSMGRILSATQPGTPATVTGAIACP